MSIGGKAVRGGFWLSGSKALQQASSLVVTAVLARLLAPEDFGLLAMLNVYIAFVAMFTSIGFGAAVINNHDATEGQISTLFWLNVALAGFSYALVIGSTPLAEMFYEEPRLSTYVWVVALGILLSPFYAIHRKLLERDLRFDLLAKIDVGTAVASGIVGVVFALLGFGVYALIFQSLSLNLIHFLLFQIVSSWRPAFIFELHRVRAMVIYSLKLKAAMVTHYFERNIDFVILGRLFDAVALGYYALAYNIMYFPVKRISYVFTEVLFPAFSAIKSDVEKVLTGYLKSMQLIAIVTFPLMTLIGLGAGPFILTLFGEKWLPVASFLALLAAAGGIQSIDQISGSVFAAIGRENVFLVTSIAKMGITAAAILIGAQYGLQGVAAGIFVAKVLSLTLNQVFLTVKTGLRPIRVLKHLLGPIIGCYAMFLAVRMFGLLHDDVSIWGLIGASTALLLLYAVTLYVVSARDLKFLAALIFSRKAVAAREDLG